MLKNIISIVLCFLVIISCSNPVSAENNKQEEDNNQNIIPPATEEELIKYGVDISQDDADIIKQIEENLKLYFQEKGIYKVILKGTAKSSYSQSNSLSFLIYTAAKNLYLNDIIIDISGINFNDSSIKSYMFAEGIGSQEDVIFTFVFPENKITVIKSYAFHMLSSLRAISIPNSVITIEEASFFQCSKLEKLTLGNSLKTIGDSAFINAFSLKELTIPNSVTTIEAGAFAYSGLVSLTLPASLVTIGDIAFSASSSLTTLTYLGKTPSDVTTVGNDIFVACTKLTTLKVPNADDIKDSKWKTFLGWSFQTVTK
ncbi:leucine-rich repeat domain-containing protein [Brachyspira pilosicoli]|uniref:leucine-rich repeat domain-containing protein n=1 Tax=Brachyspira pilosicoli TaxID=52584 RepID=UPI001C686712|nr:leucine-rich repeat domain-containing protein [Brachyspira pilosicoli]MBW5391736.1 leucine-rich repeat domain-containing protein [Brachyspira pilosicoli]